MFFLFQWLLWGQGHGGWGWRLASMTAYLVHPLCIILVRGLAKMVGLGWLQGADSMLDFAMVVVLSFLLSAGLVLLRRTFRRRRGGAYYQVPGMA